MPRSQPGAYHMLEPVPTSSNLFCLDLNPPDQLQALPVVQGQAVAGPDPQQSPSKDPYTALGHENNSTLITWYLQVTVCVHACVLTLCSQVRLEGLSFLEVLECLDGGAVLPHSILVGVTRPHKLLGTAEALVAQCHGCVDNVLTISTHHHKPGKGQGEGEGKGREGVETMLFLSPYHFLVVAHLPLGLC